MPDRTRMNVPGVSRCRHERHPISGIAKPRVSSGEKQFNETVETGVEIILAKTEIHRLMHEK